MHDDSFLEQRFSNIFIDSLTAVLKDMLDIRIEKRNTEIKNGFSINSTYGVALGITGDVVANVLYEFDNAFAEAITEMLNNKKIKDYENKNEFYTVLKGAISEIGNIISGKAIGLLSEEGMDCDITPPFVYYGKNVQVIPKNQETLYMHFNSSIGNVSINIISEVRNKNNA